MELSKSLQLFLNQRLEKYRSHVSSLMQQPGDEYLRLTIRDLQLSDVIAPQKGSGFDKAFTIDSQLIVQTVIEALMELVQKPRENGAKAVAQTLSKDEVNPGRYKLDLRIYPKYLINSELLKQPRLKSARNFR